MSPRFRLTVLGLALALAAPPVDAQAPCVVVVKASADSAAKAHLASTSLTAYQRRALARLDSLARALCAAMPTPPAPPTDTQPSPQSPPPVDTPPTPPPPVSSGVAELPRVLLSFTYPVRAGQTITVAAGGNLQAALNSAQRGDEIVLAAGATFTGTFALPAKPGTGWVVVRTSGTLPPIGTRVTPAHAAQMPKLVTTTSAAALKTAPGASGYWLSGLEIVATLAQPSIVYNMVALGSTGTEQNTLAQVPQDLVLDRMYIHGTATTNAQRCVALNSGRTQITDSYLADCHAKGFDSQAIGGWNGPGPYRIVNNTLEGAGENVMFGGGDPSIPGLVPSDIEIRRNYLVTPVAWKGVWTKKNLFELKNAVRVLVEANVLEGSWTDGQTGQAVLLKSANQSGGCRWCRTTDVTFRRNLVRNAFGFLSAAGNPEAQPVDSNARRILISENVVELNPAAGSAGRGIDLLSAVADVTIERTLVTGTTWYAMSLDKVRPAVRPVFRDNVWAHGPHGVRADGLAPGTAALTAGASSYTWSGMTLLGATVAGYPAGTMFAASEAAVPLAATIRALVQQATAGVVGPP